MKNRGFGARLGFAAAGLREGWRRERSFRSHVACAGLALLALALLRPPPVWWALVALCAGLVMTLELVNSAPEGLIDLLHPGWHPEIKVIKDMVAGAVLIASLAALLVAAALLITSAPVLSGWISR